MSSKKIQFQNSNGQTLSARLELPDKETVKHYALFAHCFTCNKNLSAVRNISRSLNEYGIAVLRFDFTGLGESEGEAENIYKAARHPKSYISLDGADHLLSNSKDSLYAGKVIAGWADRYL